MTYTRSKRDRRPYKYLLLFTLIPLMVLTGCGNKGDLVQPERAPVEVPSASDDQEEEDG